MILKTFYFFSFKGVIPDNNSVSIFLFFKLFLLLFFTQFILSIPILILRDLEFIKSTNHAISSSLETNASMQNILKIGLSVGVIYPIIEELIFRFSLTITNANNVIIGLALVSSHIITIFFNFFVYFGFDLGLYSYVLQFTIFILFFIPIITHFLPKTIIYLIVEFINSNSRLFVFCFSLLFAINHIFVSDETDYLLLYILILLPFFFAGYFYSFIRLWLGFKYSVLFHGAYNIVLLSIKILNQSIFIH